MAAEGPPPAKNDAPVTLQTGAKMPEAPNPTGATLSVAPSMPPPTTEQAQIKGNEPPVASMTVAMGGPQASTTVDFTSIQETVKAQYTALSMNPKGILGEGSFKRIIQVTPDLAVAVVKEAGPKSLAMLKSECENLTLLSKAGLPALTVHGNIFDINGKDKYAVLMEAIPNHTFVDAKDPKTIKTTLPSVLLGVEMPSNEAWFFKKTQIEKNIAQNLANPTAVAAAKDKAGLLYRQLEDIRAKLEKNEIVIVDLQLLIDSRGMIKIIDPLEVMKLGAKPGTYLTLDGKPADTGPQFERSMLSTRQMLMDMIKFCHTVSVTTNPLKLQALITPLLETGSAPSFDDELPAPSSLKGKMPPSLFQSSHHSRVGGPGSHASAAGGGYRPSSRAGLHFSSMPPPIPLPVSVTAANTPQQNAAPNQSQTATGTRVAAKDADNKPPIPPPSKGSPPPSPR
ncbi:hypothetical protein [Candidatus Berkiella aquae]|uniref:Uncharacterized protein n=1 Tax=Candidatus Berkiella aquae TaxID=295108 RepID=A0A0Q9YNR9_9GAMM|nr:hypothetical protein [Candidatus Berkiella aquae]MCS5709896.1 hypothetical protein [Candidatus Berkiella aquae]